MLETVPNVPSNTPVNKYARATYRIIFLNGRIFPVPKSVFIAKLDVSVFCSVSYTNFVMSNAHREEKTPNVTPSIKKGIRIFFLELNQ